KTAETLRVVGERLAQREAIQRLAMFVQRLPTWQLGDVQGGRGIRHRTILFSVLPGDGGRVRADRAGRGRPASRSARRPLWPDAACRRSVRGSASPAPRGCPGGGGPGN